MVISLNLLILQQFQKIVHNLHSLVWKALWPKRQRENKLPWITFCPRCKLLSPPRLERLLKDCGVKWAPSLGEAHVFECVCVFVSVCLCTGIHVSVHEGVGMCICGYECSCVCMCACVRVCIHVCICVWVCVRVHECVWGVGNGQVWNVFIAGHASALGWRGLNMF